MELKGVSLIGNQFEPAVGEAFHAWDPAVCVQLDPPYYPAEEPAVDRACQLAEKAFRTYRLKTPKERADFLEAIADQIEELGDALLERYTAESGLPQARAAGERARTCGQLRMFAGLLRESRWNRPEIEQAQPDRKPLPKPDTRLRAVALGPVAVFGPANFPLAFSVAGGDTASALAAGCPVVVKAHSSHPGVSEMVGRAVLRAAEKTGMPEGVFSLLFGRAVGPAMVKHRAIKAVGFTGSQEVGRQLFDLAAARPAPIPVFAEMASINPVLLLPGALEERNDPIAEGLYGSVTLGVGQFCTNPGLVLIPDGETGARFEKALRAQLEAHPAQPMLNKRTRVGYEEGLSRLGGVEGVDTLLDRGIPPEGNPCAAGPALYAVDSARFLEEPRLHEEVFGPVTLLVRCPDADAMRKVVESAGGQLTLTFHANDKDLEEYADLIADLELFAGRLVANGFPTGVEVCATMVHGGPYPATTDSRFTSVGGRAIERFLRPVCYQDFPEAALPPELRGDPDPSGS